MLTEKLRSAIHWHLGHADEARRNIERLAMSEVTRDALFEECGPIPSHAERAIAYSFSTPFGSVPIVPDQTLPENVVEFWSHGKPVVRCRIG